MTPDLLNTSLAPLDVLFTAKEYLLRNRDAAIDGNNASDKDIRDDFRCILSASPGTRPLFLTDNRKPIACTQNI
jgi:hypothetical protein